MSILERFTRNGTGDEASLRETAKRQRWQLEHLSESMRQLEDQLVDGEWRRIGAQLEREFTRGGLDDMISLSRAMYVSHPLIQRAVNVTTYYTWGQGVEVTANEKLMERLITPTLEEESNQIELFGHQARLLTDVDQLVDGNTFTACFKGVPPKFRTIPTEEIRNIYCNPEDRGEVWFYYREWNPQTLDQETGRSDYEVRKGYYPDISCDLASKPETIGGIPVYWDAPVIHQRTGGLKQMRFGLPSTYAALDWARAYKKFLEDWHTIVSSLARFAWRASTKSKKGGKVDRIRSKLDAVEGSDDELNEGSSWGRGGLPAGNVWVGNEGDDLTPIPKTGAHTSADDAKPSRLMIGAAMDLPDTILSGDPDQGNLATAKTLDRPTELAMGSRQKMWKAHDERLFAWTVRQAELLVPGVLSGVPEDERKVEVKFPSILEHDMKDLVTAIVTAATLNGKADAGTIPREQVSRLLMQAVGVDDVEAAIGDLDGQEQEQLGAAIERLAEALTQDGGLGA